MESTSPSWVPLLIAFFIGAIFVLVGILLIYLNIRAKRKIAESQQWPTIAGAVVSSEVQRMSSTDSEGDTTYYYQPKVEYSYSVMGTAYTGKRLTFAAQGSSQKSAQAVVQRYPVGATVTVHYNPQKPAEAVLEVQATSGNTCMLVGGIVFIVVGIISAGVGLVMTVVQYVD